MHTSVVPSPALSHRSDFELTGECRSTNNSSGGLSCAKPSSSPRSFSCSLWERAMPRLRRLAGVRSIMSAARGSTVARNACRNVTTTSARAINARWFWWVERRHKGQRQGLPRSLRGPNIPAGESRRRRIRRRTERRRAGVIDAGREQAREQIAGTGLRRPPPSSFALRRVPAVNPRAL